MIEIYFSGCWDSVGHYVYLPNGKPAYVDGVGPWRFLDSPRLHPQTHGDAWLTHEAGWTALGIGDRSVDNRAGSASVFAMTGIYDFDQALNLAKGAFPDIIARIAQIGDITLIDRAKYQ